MVKNNIKSVEACFFPKGLDAMDIINDKMAILTSAYVNTYHFLDFMAHYFNKKYPEQKDLHELGKEIEEIKGQISQDREYYSDKVIRPFHSKYLIENPNNINYTWKWDIRYQAKFAIM